MPFTPNYSKVVYLVRDGRNVAVSYYFHLMKYEQISKDTKLEDFIVVDFNAGFIDKYTSCSSNVNSWLKNAPKKFLLLGYEDLKANPLGLLVILLLSFMNCIIFVTGNKDVPMLKAIQTALDKTSCDTYHLRAQQLDKLIRKSIK